MLTRSWSDEPVGHGTSPITGRRPHKNLRLRCFSWAPVQARRGDQQIEDFAARLRTSRKNINRLASEGLSDQQADAIAAALGDHPSALWPDWFALQGRVICRWCLKVAVDESCCPWSLRCPSCGAQPGALCRGSKAAMHIARIREAERITELTSPTEGDLR